MAASCRNLPPTVQMQQKFIQKQPVHRGTSKQPQGMRLAKCKLKKTWTQCLARWLVVESLLCVLKGLGLISTSAMKVGHWSGLERQPLVPSTSLRARSMSKRRLLIKRGSENCVNCEWCRSHSQIHLWIHEKIKEILKSLWMSVNTFRYNNFF